MKFCLLFCLLLSLRPDKAQTNRKLQLLSESHFQFSIDLYNEVAKTRKDNIVLAPHNVNLGLALLFLGTTANSTSSRELRNFYLVKIFQLYGFEKLILKHFIFHYREIFYKSL